MVPRPEPPSRNHFGFRRGEGKEKETGRSELGIHEMNRAIPFLVRNFLRGHLFSVPPLRLSGEGVFIVPRRGNSSVLVVVGRDLREEGGNMDFMGVPFPGGPPSTLRSRTCSPLQESRRRTVYGGRLGLWRSSRVGIGDSGYPVSETPSS